MRARATGDAVQLSSSLHSLGELLRLEGRGDEATACLDECMTVATNEGWRHLIWWPTLSLAALAREQRELGTAREFLARAIGLCPKLARRARQADCGDELVLLLAAEGDDAGAARALGAVDAAREVAHLPRPPVYAAYLDDVRLAVSADDVAAGSATELPMLLRNATGG